jgi:heme exporter protein D
VVAAGHGPGLNIFTATVGDGIVLAPCGILVKEVQGAHSGLGTAHLDFTAIGEEGFYLTGDVGWLAHNFSLFHFMVTIIHGIPEKSSIKLYQIVSYGTE